MYAPAKETLVMFMQPQTKTNRSLGNSQSRLSAMPSSPAYGNTTNVNGAQTAASASVMRFGRPSAMIRNSAGELAFPNITPDMPPVEQMMFRNSRDEQAMFPASQTGTPAGVSPNLGSHLTPDFGYQVSPTGRVVRIPNAAGYSIPRVPNSPMAGLGQPTMPDPVTSMGAAMPPQVPFSSTMQGNGQASYPGGDAPGIASYYRNSAIQGYQGGQQQQQSAMAGDIREATRNAQYMAAEPPATSSTGVNQMMARQPTDLQNAVTARAANSYNGVVGAMSDPNRLTPDQKAGLARESALRATGGGPAADPTGLGARFGGAFGQQASADSDAIRNGQAVRLADGSVSRFTGTPESAREAQNKGKVERENLRDRNNLNVPQEELDRRKAADAQKAARSNRARAFENENEGLTYKHMDRLERKFILKQKAVREGRKSQEQADAEMAFEKDKMVRRSRDRASALPNSDQAKPLSGLPNRPNLATQPPEVAKAAVETMVTKSPVIKELGWTAQSKPQDVMNSIAGMNPQQMTSTQKFEAARSIHEYMLSQVESGNPDYAIEDGIASDGSDPRIGFIGLNGIKPGDKDAMVRWFDDLHRQSQALSKVRPPAGMSPLAPLAPQENQGGFASPRQGNPF